jgi:acyl-CoA thioesterase
MTPQEIARHSADRLWAEDDAAKDNGISVNMVGPGEASLSMTVTRAMTNGHGIAHGGFIFLLADTAFAYACNSYNKRCVDHLPEARAGRLAAHRSGARGEPGRAQRHL